MEELQEELRQIFLFEVCYQSGLHQELHPLSSVALIEIKRGDMFGSGAMSGAQEAGQITPFWINYPRLGGRLGPIVKKWFGEHFAKLNSKTFPFFAAELFCGRYDSTNFDR